MKKLKEFDYKTFLLEKGERIGLIVAGVLAGLFFFGMAYTWATSGSSAERAEVLSRESQRVGALLNDQNRKPTNPQDLPHPDAEKQSQKVVTWDPVFSRTVALAPLNLVVDGPGGGRKLPKVFPIDEAAASVDRVQ